MKAIKLTHRHARATLALVAEFRRLVDALADRLAPGPNGQKKVFHDRTVDNLREFFRHYEELNAGALSRLGQAVALAREVLSDWQPHELRILNAARQEVAAGLAQVSEQLSPLVAAGVPHRPKEIADVPGPSDVCGE